MVAQDFIIKLWRASRQGVIVTVVSTTWDPTPVDSASSISQKLWKAVTAAFWKGPVVGFLRTFLRVPAGSGPVPLRRPSKVTMRAKWTERDVREKNRGNKLAHWTMVTKLLLTLYKEQNSCFSIHWGSSSCRAIPLSTVSLRNATVDAGTHDAHYLLQHLFHLFWPVRGQERDCCTSAFCRCDGRILDNLWLQYCSFSKNFKYRKNPTLPLCQQIQNSWLCPIPSHHIWNSTRALNLIVQCHMEDWLCLPSLVAGKLSGHDEQGKIGIES